LQQSSQHITEIGSDLPMALSLLNSGEIIAIPTETVYGLAGNALNEQAVLKIFQVKERPLHNPLIIHVASTDRIKQVVKEIPPYADILMRYFPEGPITYLLPRNQNVPDLTCAGLPRVAVRIPSHPMTRELLSQLDFPLAAPSANPFGYISPTRADHVLNQLNGRIPYILDGGPCTKGIESTIIGFENDRPVIYRQGSQSVESIEDVIGQVTFHTANDKNPEAPGMLSQHYSPRTKFIYDGDFEAMLLRYPIERIGYIAFEQMVKELPAANQFVLSANGDLNEAAMHLYEAMHWMDSKNLDIIFAEQIPRIGIGAAIHDRLMRASF